MPAPIVSADKKFPAHRGEGWSTLFSGNITLKHMSELTDDDVKEISERYKCKARIGAISSNNPMKYLTVT